MANYGAATILAVDGGGTNTRPFGQVGADRSFSGLDLSVISTEVERSRAVRRDSLPATGAAMTKPFSCT